VTWIGKHQMGTKGAVAPGVRDGKKHLRATKKVDNIVCNLIKIKY